MKMSDVFQSKYLKADDLKGQDRAVTIRDVQMENVGTGAKAENKPVIYFEGVKKGLVCNKTNFGTIAKLHGDDSDNWPGKRVTLFPTEVEYQGEMMLSIRVRMRAPAAAANGKAGAAGKPAAAPPPQDDEPGTFDEPAPQFGDGSEESEAPF